MEAAVIGKEKRARGGPLKRKRVTIPFVSPQACGELLLPLGEATGGQGVPGVGLIPELLGDVPPLLVWPFPVPPVDEFGFEEDEFGDAEFCVEPEFGAVGDPFAVPGKVPHGDPFGELPGFGV